MPIIWRIFLTVVFGFAWWFCFIWVGPGLAWLMILGSILAVCACCCQGGREPSHEFNYQAWFTCIRRCWLATATLMVGLIILGAVVVAYTGGSVAAEWAHILVAAIAGPWFVRLICCAYEN